MSVEIRSQYNVGHHDVITTLVKSYGNFNLNMLLKCAVILDYLQVLGAALESYQFGATGSLKDCKLNTDINILKMRGNVARLSDFKGHACSLYCLGILTNGLRI